jgi:RNA polymerase sigma-70 factor (ECF subfamily)
VISEIVVSRETHLDAESLCANYAAVVSRFAALCARDKDEAEDIAQEALLKAIRHLDRFDPARGSTDAWLWRIVANTAHDMARRGVARRLLRTRLALWREPGEAVEPMALRRLESIELLDAVRQLPPRDRMLIGLRYGADLDIDEVAAAVGLRSDSAGRAVRRAVDRLRSILATEVRE